MYINLNNNPYFTGLKSHRKFFTKKNIEKIIITPSMSESKKRKASRDNKILEMLAEGLNFNKIAESLGISFSTVKRIFEKYKVHQKAVAIRDEIILTKLLKGEKRKKIAKDLDISIRSVHDVAEKNNIYRLKKKERDEKIIQAYAKGLLYKEIAKEFNISKATITRVIKQHNKDYNSKLY